MIHLQTARIHATALQLVCGTNELGVLLLGPSGSGKSSLTLRLIDCPGACAANGAPICARLVSDDQVELSTASHGLEMTAPATIAGLLEVRGLGLLKLPEVCRKVMADVAFEHVAGNGGERLPEQAAMELHGFSIPLFRMDFFQPDAAARVRMVAQQLWGLVNTID